MAIVKPFHLVHYNGKCSDRLDALITPPYDVISPAQQEEFHQAHPLNCIRLVLGKKYPEDDAADNKYTRAAQTMHEWLNDGTLVRENRPGMMVYQMEFEQPDGGRRIIDGLVCLVKVDDYGKGRVLPHEKTYRGPKEDQLQLLRACKAHLTPIHGLFPDSGDEVRNEYSRFTASRPDQEAVDSNGVIHRSWAIFDEQSLNKIQNAVKPESILIADGHHRYETALAFKREAEESGMRVQHNGHEYVMMFLTSMTHPGLTILTAHRMVKGLPEFDTREVMDKLQSYFHIEEFPFTDATREQTAQKFMEAVSAEAETGGVFGIATKGENVYRLIRMKDFNLLEERIDPSIPAALKTLDVTILREVIMGYGWNMDDNGEGLIEYTPSAFEALERVHAGEFQVCFVFNPTRPEQVKAAAESGHKLPQKSTYFFPKIASGLVFNVF